MSNRHISMLRPRDVFALSGRPRTTCYADVKAGLLPPFVKIGPRASALPAHELTAIINARIAGKSCAEIRKLVKQLIAARNG